MLESAAQLLFICSEPTVIPITHGKVASVHLSRIVAHLSKRQCSGAYFGDAESDSGSLFAHSDAVFRNIDHACLSPQNQYDRHNADISK